MNKTISLFKSTNGTIQAFIHDNTFYEYEKDECWADAADEYIRISKPVEVDFPEVDKTEILQKELELIDKAEKTITAEYQLKLTALQNRRNDLLSISHDSGNNNQE